MANEVAFSDRQDRTVMDTRVYAPHVAWSVPGMYGKSRLRWKNNPHLDAWTEQALQRFFEDRLWERYDFAWITPPVERHSYRYKEVRGKTWTGFTETKVAVDSDLAEKIKVFARAHGVSTQTVLHNAMHYEAWCQSYIGSHNLREDVEDERPYYYYDHRICHYCILRSAFKDFLEHNADKIRENVENGRMPAYMLSALEQAEDMDKHHQQAFDDSLVETFRENFDAGDNAVLVFEDREYRSFMPKRFWTAEDRALYSSKRAVRIPDEVRKVLAAFADLQGLDLNEFLVETVKDFVAWIRNDDAVISNPFLLISTQHKLYEIEARKESRRSGAFPEIFKFEVGEKYVLETLRGADLHSENNIRMKELFKGSSVELDFYKSGKTLIDMERFAEDECHKNISAYDIIENALLYKYQAVYDYFMNSKDGKKYDIKAMTGYPDDREGFETPHRRIHESIRMAKCFAEHERVIEWTPLDDFPTNGISDTSESHDKDKSFIVNLRAVIAAEERMEANNKLARESSLVPGSDLDHADAGARGTPAVARRGIVAGLAGVNGGGNQVNAPIPARPAFPDHNDAFLYRPAADAVTAQPRQAAQGQERPAASSGHADRTTRQDASNDAMRAALLGMTWHDPVGPTP